MTRFAFYTLGCKSNQYETNQMKEQAARAGFEIVPFHDKADFYVINTCTVTQNADKKSRHILRQIKKQNPSAKIIATGCYTEISGRSDLKEIDLMLKNKDKKQLLKKLKEKGWVKTRSKLESRQISQRRRAFLMIENGCPQNCSYCIVPVARGKTISSKPPAEVIAEAKQLIASGAREIILTGINLGAYQFDLVNLLKELSGLDNLLRIRLSSIEPMFVTKELIDAIAKTPKVCPHLHIPLQSGDREILRAMQRPYTPKEYLELAQHAKKKIPHLGLNTDIIVGFPGETDAQFNHTLKLIKKINFSRIHIFTYSRREGTAAAKYPAQVPPQIKQQRYRALNHLREELLVNFARKYQGEKVEILVEGVNGNLVEGLTPNYIRVKVKRKTGRSLPLLLNPKIRKVYPEFCLGSL